MVCVCVGEGGGLIREGDNNYRENITKKDKPATEERSQKQEVSEQQKLSRRRSGP